MMEGSRSARPHGIKAAGGLTARARHVGLDYRRPHSLLLLAARDIKGPFEKGKQWDDDGHIQMEQQLTIARNEWATDPIMDESYHLVVLMFVEPYKHSDSIGTLMDSLSQIRWENVKGVRMTILIEEQ